MSAYRIGLLGAVITLALGCTTTIDAVTSGPDGEGGGEMSSSAASGVGGNPMASGVGAGGTTTNTGVGVGGSGGFETSSSSGMGVGGEPMTGSVTGVGGSGGFETSSSSGMGGNPMTGSGSGSGGEGGGGPACGTPDPVGQLTYCGGTATGATGGMNTMCTTFLCDDNGNIWEATCTNDSCTCAYNSQEVCSCGLDPSAETCTGMGCCPMPWVNP